MTILEKVNKELAFLTRSMGLDASEQKHWFYRLKREYEAEAKVLRRMKQRQAKKEFRKKLKKY